jgi:hypothetical protein
MKSKILDKENHPSSMQAAQNVERQRMLLVDTLTSMVPDDDNLILPDYSFYNEYDQWYVGYPI